MSFDFIYKPFAWILELFYNMSGNYIVALFFFAIIFKLILLPSSISQQKGMAKTQRLQPKIRRIQARYAGDQRKIQEETQALYQREGYNPMSAQGCLPLLIQMPIILILYRVIYRPLTYVLGIAATDVGKLTEAVKGLGIKLSGDTQIEMDIMNNFSKVKDVVGADTQAQIADFVENFKLFGIPLTTKPSFSALSGDNLEAKLLLLIPILSALTSLLTSVITQHRQKKQNPEMAKNPATGCMTYAMPIMSGYFATLFPAGIGIYWIFQNILTAIQTIILGRVYSQEKVLAKTLVVETIMRRSKENNIKVVSEMKDKD